MSEIRKFLHKNISTPKIRSAFEMTQRYGIMARAYFIYGAPQESRQTIQETIDLMDSIKPLGAIFCILDIFPGTALYEDFKQRLNATDDIWLNRIEDIMYFETDPALTREMILAYGQKLRSAFYDSLPGYVEALRLIDEEDLYPRHSSFFSRLALTFDHGDYSAIDGIKHKDRLVEKLYRQSLNYYPNAEAFLGLGIIRQKQGDHREAVAVLNEGLTHFPNDVRLNICLGVGLMNLAQYHEALARFLDFPNEKDALQFAARCYEALGDHEKAALMMDKYEAM